MFATFQLTPKSPDNYFMIDFSFLGLYTLVSGVGLVEA